MEYGFSLIRPDDVGYSLAADYLGRLTSVDTVTAANKAIVAYVSTRGARTLYTQIGDAVAWASKDALVMRGYGERIVLLVLVYIRLARHPNPTRATWLIWLPALDEWVKGPFPSSMALPPSKVGGEHPMEGRCLGATLVALSIP